MCAPGGNARVQTVRITGAGYALRLMLDPETVVIRAPNGPDGDKELAAFLRSLARESGLLAHVLDPSGRKRQPVRRDAPNGGGGVAT